MMTFTQVQGDALFAAVQSKAQQLNVFDTVTFHEPKSAPQGLAVLALWLSAVTPLGPASGLGITSGRVSLRGRIYLSDLQKPEDATEGKLLSLVSALFGAVTGNFTLGGLVMEVDLLGIHGESLGATAGYLDQDGKFFRTADVTVPLIVSDLWEQVP
jgi:hypothetical protein